MKRVWGGGLLAFVLLTLVALLLMHTKNPPSSGKRPVPTAPSAPDVMPAQTNAHPQARNLGVRRPNLTPEEKADLAKRFSDKIKPAVDEWCKAYEGHVPFRPEDLTLDKFKERIGMNASFYIYTFMLGDITLCVQDSGGRVVVNYLNAPQSRELTQIPNGAQPTLELPLSETDVIRMVKTDTGTEFRPSEVLIRPTGQATRMNGGAFVEIGPRGGNPDIGPCKLSLVFAPGGNLAYYCRDPFL